MVDTTESAGGPLLPPFYAGRSILITGGSGFLGKLDKYNRALQVLHKAGGPRPGKYYRPEILLLPSSVDVFQVEGCRYDYRHMRYSSFVSGMVLIERLLSTCPDVHELHLLMRDKRGQEPLKRLAQLKQSQAFDNVKARCPWQMDKLRVVSGDVAQPRLGLDDAALTQLQEVSVVFHSAATTKFWESLETALHQNVTSVITLMDLCDQLPKLEALVHVSTAYSNAEHQHIEERVYAAPASLASLRALVQALPPPLLDELTARFILPKPNTYVFSKAIAESMIDQRPARHYFIAIVRPSIVVSSHRYPYPGWIENLAGPSGVVVGCGKGLLHAFNVDQRARADLIPVDVTIDTMLAVAWEIATDKSHEVRVYNSCSQENPITWGSFRSAFLRATRRHPFDNSLYYPFVFGVKNRYVYKTLQMLLQTAPLYVTNYIAQACGVKMHLVTASERLQAMSSVLAYFATREWQFSTDNVQRLRARLTRQDRAIYSLDIRAVNWDEHTFNFVKGVRKYLLKEKDENLQNAKQHINRSSKPM